MKFDTPIFQLKRRAKQLAQGQSLPLHHALDQVAKEQGFKNWAHLSFFERHERNAITLLKDLQPGDLVLLGARPRQGKTMLALQLLARAVQIGFKGFFFTLEYTEDEVWERLERFDLMRQRDDRTLMVDTSNEICADYICDRLKEDAELSVVVIDYLQLLDQNRDTPDLQRQVEQLSHFAKENKAIIVVLSQIDRHFDPTLRPVPNVDDIRLSNPLEISRFTKACFMHNGEMQLASNP